MKTHIITNIILVIVITLLLAGLTLFSIKIFTVKYYLAVFFYFAIYLMHTFLLARKEINPTRFVAIHNFSTIVKMISALIYLLVYFLLFTESIDNHENIQFVIFFGLLYFLFLICNSVNFFNSPNEKDAKKKSI
jgi:FlaA1/EpsC-like NDP-sugar epimerase